LWLADSTQVSEEDDHHFLRLLSDTELHRYKTFLRPERRRQFLLGRTLLRFAVSEVTGLAVDDLQVKERPGNAPKLVLPYTTRLNLSFSLSHARQWVACAIGLDCRLGLDVEANDPKRDVYSISELVFHPRDRKWLVKHDPAETVKVFYDLWCTREALFKLFPEQDRTEPLHEPKEWYRYSTIYQDFTIVVCSDRNLSSLAFTLQQVALTEVVSKWS